MLVTSNPVRAFAYSPSVFSLLTKSPRKLRRLEHPLTSDRLSTFSENRKRATFCPSSSGGAAKVPVDQADIATKEEPDTASPSVGKTDPEIDGDSVPAKTGIWAKVKNILFGGKLDKERIKALGIGAVLSYGVVSNVSYGTCVVIAWITHVNRTGLSPFAPGQWSGFLAVYAGLFALQNFLRPVRFTAAVAMTPVVDRLMGWVQKRLNVKKPVAFGLLMFGLAVSTMSLMVLALWILGGFPPNPPPS